MDNKNKIIFLSIAFVVLASFGYYFFVDMNKPGKYDTFAACLQEKGAKFYGAFWCPHCQKQKALFEGSAKKLPYVECSTPNGKEMNQMCKDKGVEGYPTWIFSDGTKLTGEQTLEDLSKKTSCPIQ